MRSARLPHLDDLGIVGDIGRFLRPSAIEEALEGDVLGGVGKDRDEVVPILVNDLNRCRIVIHAQRLNWQRTSRSGLLRSSGRCISAIFRRTAFSASCSAPAFSRAQRAAAAAARAGCNSAQAAIPAAISTTGHGSRPPRNRIAAAPRAKGRKNEG